MNKTAKIIATVLIALLLIGGTSLLVLSNKQKRGVEDETEIMEPISWPTGKTSEIIENLTKKKYDTEFEENEPFHILLMGIDRRSKYETAYRTDIMILLSVNPHTNKATLTSVPRDLWVDGRRINAIYIEKGWEGIQSAIADITGITPQKYIMCDFEDLVWIVDAMGGVPVQVEKTFTDVEYPNDKTKTYMTIAFTAGEEILTGERALIYARSRHGNNGEGSDWMRMQRQHLILKGMLDSVVQPTSIFRPMNVEKAYKMVTEGRMGTNLSVGDAKYLWDYYKDKDKYVISSLYLNSDYVYSPPMEDYGGAWVLIPKENAITQFQTDLNTALN